MALRAHLIDDVMALPEPDRLELVDHILSASREGNGGEDAIVDPDGLRASLERSQRDVAAGRTRPAHELLADLRAALR